MPDGSIKVQGQLAHPGVVTYRNDDGTPRREYRPQAVVFNKESLASFSGAPVTLNHPPQGKITAESWKRDAIGHLGDSVRQDGEYAVADIYVRDAMAVAAVKRGDLKHISIGYDVDYDPTPGETPTGERYDGVQTACRGNHVALLSKGFAPRAGTGCTLRLDSNQDEVYDSQEVAINPSVTPEQIAALEAQIVVLTGEVTKLRTDAVEVAGIKTKLTETETKLATAQAAVTPERLDALVEERQAVCVQAVAAGVDPKGQTTLQLKRAIVAKRTPALATRVDSFGPEAVDALLAVYVAEPHPSMRVLGSENATAKPTAARADALPTIHELHEKARLADVNAWKNGGDLNRKGSN
jgi:hypothetical protein